MGLGRLHKMKDKNKGEGSERLREWCFKNGDSLC
jgi:hypothetical protein